MELSKNKASVIATLSSKKMRTKHGLFVAEGEKCVFDMLGSFELDSLIVSKEWLTNNEFKQESLRDKIFITDNSIIKKISSLSTPSSIIGVFKLPEEKKVEVLRQELYLVLDGIQDPGNLGTIIRTADWFGIHQIFASHNTADVFNPKTIQSTMGSLKRVRVNYTSLSSLFEAYSEMPVYGLMLDGRDIYKSSLKNYGFIVMGNEGNGISDEIRKYITAPLLIPPYKVSSHGESLNVAIATAITLSRFRFG